MGSFGDILWSLATVQRLSKFTGQKLDFGIMPEYKTLVPLIQAQPYIDNAFPVEGWLQMHCNYGAQPWNPPQHTACLRLPIGPALVAAPYKCQAGWEQCWHLGYRAHPGRTFGQPEMQLIDYIAWQQGMHFMSDNPLPFLYCPTTASKKLGAYVAYAFNDMYGDLKRVFLQELTLKLQGDVRLIDTTKLPWLDALAMMYHAEVFVGCRSSNWVIAMGLGKKTYTYEPHPARHREGHLGFVFGCSYGVEVTAPFAMPPNIAADHANSILRQWIKESKEKASETVPML